MLNEFIATFLRTFCVVILDPNIENASAIRCNEKAGFKMSGYSEDEDYLIMLKIKL